VLLFGGQSSRDAGMFDRLEAADPVAGEAARRRAARYLSGPITDFSSNQTVQVSVTSVTLGWLEVLGEAGLRSTESAGLSLGEYAHLVDMGALDPEDAVALVAMRGELYDRGPLGAMAAIFPAAWEDLAPLLERVAAEHGGVEALAPAVFNSPSQTVVGGTRAAVDALIEAAEEELFARGVVVEERIPMHTPRFQPVTAPFRAVLHAAPWTGRARVRYRPNLTGSPSASDPATLVSCLSRHVTEPVRWMSTVDALVSEYPDALFLEIGPRTVLRDLMLRRWHADKEVLSVDDPEVPLEAVAERVAATLEHVKQALHEPVPASAARAPSRQPSTDRPVPASSSSDADSRSVGGVAGGTP
jgi:[acyl-carrier-protein] S-malonyltransferase